MGGEEDSSELAVSCIAFLPEVVVMSQGWGEEEWLGETEVTRVDVERVTLSSHLKTWFRTREVIPRELVGW